MYNYPFYVKGYLIPPPSFRFFALLKYYWTFLEIIFTFWNVQITYLHILAKIICIRLIIYFYIIRFLYSTVVQIYNEKISYRRKKMDAPLVGTDLTIIRFIYKKNLSEVLLLCVVQ